MFIFATTALKFLTIKNTINSKIFIQEHFNFWNIDRTATTTNFKLHEFRFNCVRHSTLKVVTLPANMTDDIVAAPDNNYIILVVSLHYARVVTCCTSRTSNEALVVNHLHFVMETATSNSILLITISCIVIYCLNVWLPFVEQRTMM